MAIVILGMFLALFLLYGSKNKQNKFAYQPDRQYPDREYQQQPQQRSYYYHQRIKQERQSRQYRRYNGHADNEQ
jgi:hypothetical protein